MQRMVTALGCLTAPTHYYNEHNLCTDMPHHHSAAKALFAGHRTTFLLHRLMCRFVRFNSLASSITLSRDFVAFIWAIVGLLEQITRHFVTKPK